MEKLDELQEWASKLRSLDNTNSLDEEIKTVLEQFGAAHIFTARIAKGATIIRARTELDFNGPNQILYESQISYRKDLQNVRRGRCNLDREAAFYGVLMTTRDKFKAEDRITCFSEVSKIGVMQLGTEGTDYTTTGIWTVTEPFDVVAFSHDEKLGNNHEIVAEMRREFAKASQGDNVTNKEKGVFFQKIFSGIYGDPNSPYRVSACMASLLFSRGCKGILYPSVQTEGIGLNLALPSITVDNHLRIRNALVERIHKVGKQVVADPYLECYEIRETDSGNMLVWQEGHSAGKPAISYLLKPGN